MYRLLALLLLLLMPVQFAFAAAAPYCAMEKAEAKVHFGHHEYVESAVPAPADEGDDKSKLHDCEICHLGCGQVHAAAVSIPALRPMTGVSMLLDDRQPQHLQEPTERPPRTSLA